MSIQPSSWVLHWLTDSRRCARHRKQVGRGDMLVALASGCANRPAACSAAATSSGQTRSRDCANRGRARMRWLRSRTACRVGRSGKHGSAPMRHRRLEPRRAAPGRSARRSLRGVTPSVAPHSHRGLAAAPFPGGSCVFRLGSRFGPCMIAPAAINSSGANKAIRKRTLNDICPPLREPRKAELPTSIPYHKRASRCVRYVTCRIGMRMRRPRVLGGIGAPGTTESSGTCDHTHTEQLLLRVF